MITNLAVQNILKGILHTKENDKHSQENMGESKSHYMSIQAN
jgi:hypothetical protein